MVCVVVMQAGGTRRSSVLWDTNGNHKRERSLSGQEAISMGGADLLPQAGLTTSSRLEFTDKNTDNPSWRCDP